MPTDNQIGAVARCVFEYIQTAVGAEHDVVIADAAVDHHILDGVD